MPSPRVSATVSRAREELAWELRVKGMREQQIADELDRACLGRVTRQAVSAMLIRVEARALKGLSKQVEGYKLRQSEALWLIYAEAMAAWEKSKEPDKSITRKVATNALGAMEPAGGEPITMTVRDSDGDPRHLAEARAALADLRKLWGLDAPTKIAPTTPDGDEPYYPELVALLEELLPPLGPR
jgi:hypothetical protein